jgi:hypothetical protein
MLCSEDTSCTYSTEQLKMYIIQCFTEMYDFIPPTHTVPMFHRYWITIHIHTHYTQYQF